MPRVFRTNGKFENGRLWVAFRITHRDLIRGDGMTCVQVDKPGVYLMAGRWYGWPDHHRSYGKIGRELGKTWAIPVGRFHGRNPPAYLVKKLEHWNWRKERRVRRCGFGTSES